MSFIDAATHNIADRLDQWEWNENTFIYIMDWIDLLLRTLGMHTLLLYTAFYRIVGSWLRWMDSSNMAFRLRWSLRLRASDQLLGMATMNSLPESTAAISDTVDKNPNRCRPRCSNDYWHAANPIRSSVLYMYITIHFVSSQVVENCTWKLNLFTSATTKIPNMQKTSIEDFIVVLFVFAVCRWRPLVDRY